MAERSWWGWGTVEAALPDDQCAALAAGLPGCGTDPVPVPDVGSLTLSAPRVRPPAALADRFSDAPPDRAAHTYGKAFRDVVRALAGDVAAAPDLVAFPTDEADVAAVLDWAGEARVAVLPYGGGSSVVGGTEYRPELGGDHAGAVSLDLSRLDRVLQVDTAERAVRVQGGVLGPALENGLRPHGLTLRHFPQSFEFSSVGGWLATRAGGHYAMGATHIDDMVQAMRVVTPAGAGESWRLPASGAGPSPDRLFLGSEGILGVITEAWLRVVPRPEHRASASVAFTSFPDALAALRAVARSGLVLANCRLLDHGEAQLSGAATGEHAVLVLGAESALGPVDLAAPLEIASAHGGQVAERADAVGAWRSAFLRMPYVRDGLARCGAVVETFETACTWDRAESLVEAVRAEVGAAVREVCGVDGLVNCRVTHVYPDGPAPYFTVLAGGRPGMQLGAWDEIKTAAMEVLTRHRATVTHHHAVGRDHRPGYDRQRPEPFAVALRAVKAALDPHGVLNPGVLL